MENKKSKKKSANPLQEAFSTLREATTEEYVDILKDEWNEMLERGREPIIEFDNGDYYYIEPDWENKKFYAGPATNTGIIREIEVPMDPDMNLDEHIAELFDTAIDSDPSLLVDDDWNDPDTEVEFVNIGEGMDTDSEDNYFEDDYFEDSYEEIIQDLMSRFGIDRETAEEWYEEGGPLTDESLKEGFPTDDELMAEIKRNNEEGIKNGSAKEFSDILFDTIMGNTRYPNINPDLIDDAEDNEVDSNAHWMTINYGGHKYKISVELVESKKSPKGKRLREDRTTSAKLPIKVYMDFINYLGEVNESTLIAAFLNQGWAKDFIEFAKQKEDKLTKIRVEEN